MAVNPTTLPGKPGGFLDKSVAGSANVSLSPIESRCRVLRFSGVITGNIVVFVGVDTDDAGVDYLVENATTGAFSVTLKGIRGSGLVVTQAKKVVAAWTGSDFSAWTAEL